MAFGSDTVSVTNVRVSFSQVKTRLVTSGAGAVRSTPHAISNGMRTAPRQRRNDGHQWRTGDGRRRSIGHGAGDRGASRRRGSEGRHPRPSRHRGGGRRRGDRWLLLRMRHHRLRGHRADRRRGHRGVGRARRRRERRRWRHRQEDARQDRCGARPRVVPPGRRPQPGRHVQPQPVAGRGDGEERTERRRRARRDHQHRVDRRVRGSDRPDRLHRVEGRRRRACR